MADTQAKKILNGVWASDDAADRFDPADVGLTRTEGWPVRYEQTGSGAEPEREVFQQRFRELDSFATDVMRDGLPLPWDADIDYVQDAFVRSSDGRLYRATVATGPTTGNNTDPTDEEQTIWSLY